MKLSIILYTAALAAASSTTAQTTPVPTFTVDCINVSVKVDATYCIKGPICSGSNSSRKKIQTVAWGCAPAQERQQKLQKQDFTELAMSPAAR
ncbi:hypothetical protein FI667_g15276, partial [Globisporangium splendens]